MFRAAWLGLRRLCRHIFGKKLLLSIESFAGKIGRIFKPNGIKRYNFIQLTMNIDLATLYLSISTNVYSPPSEYSVYLFFSLPFFSTKKHYYNRVLDWLVHYFFIMFLYASLGQLDLRTAGTKLIVSTVILRSSTV